MDLGKCSTLKELYFGGRGIQRGMAYTDGDHSITGRRSGAGPGFSKGGRAHINGKYGTKTVCVRLHVCEVTPPPPTQWRIKDLKKRGG